jgi:hypothetical protein
MARVMEHPIDWLLAMLLSWAIPLEVLGWKVSYFTSLWFWLVPVVLLLPRLFFETDAGGRRRRAFWGAALFTFVAGLVLDFVLGRFILRFNSDTSIYIRLLGPIPIEEVFFYLLGGMAIVLVYVWADEYWMHRYNVRQRRANDELFGPNFRLIEFSTGAFSLALILIGCGIALKWAITGTAWPPPYYFTFLVTIAVAPAVAIYRPMKDVVNWRAFSFTCLYVLVTSCIWEVTLGIPRKWWWYREPPAVIGWYVGPFGSLPERPYPIEALIVWFVICFDAIFAFEFLKAVAYERRPLRKATLGY